MTRPEPATHRRRARQATRLAATTGGAGGICETYATRYVECIPGADRAMLLANCEDTLELLSYYSAACGMAAEDYYVCLTGLPCPDLPSGAGCEAEEEQIPTICDLG